MVPCRLISPTRIFYFLKVCFVLLALILYFYRWRLNALAENELADLIGKSENSSRNLHPVEEKCPMYQEFRHLNFLHPLLQHELCFNAVAYKKYSDGFPLCQLPSPFNKAMLDIVRQGSDLAGLLGVDRTWMAIYVYYDFDIISSTIRQHSSWEPQLVQWILSFVHKLTDVTFLDIGSNIGVYSLQAARFGLPVVSVDANIRNLLRLRLSLNAASLEASLVWNFIAPDQNLKYLSFLADCNVGGAGRAKSDLPDTVPVMPLKSERLGSLIKTKNIVIKMDIQGGETDFLLTSGRLFTDFNVAAVQMEWSASMTHGYDAILMAKFFVDRGYKVWKVPEFLPLNPDKTESWSSEIDVVWIHKDFLNVILL